MKESIKLKCFIADVEKHMPDAVESGLYKEDVIVYYECSKCGRSYKEGDKFCTVDGEKIISK